MMASVSGLSFLFLLVAILSETLLSLVRGDFVTLSFFTAGHSYIF